MRQIVQLMHEAFVHASDLDYLTGLQHRVMEMSMKFPVPSL